jgi:hypothetical protein
MPSWAKPVGKWIDWGFAFLRREHFLQRKKAKTQVHGYVESVDLNDATWYDHVHVVPRVEREEPCLAFAQKPVKK